MTEKEATETEGATPTTTQQLKEFADTVTKTSLERLSLEGQLKQALISLERYIDEDEQILAQKEMVIPKYALSKARGIVFLSIIKCGFVFAGCIGTGCVVVKNSNNEWSGPSSIMCAGLSVGLLAGASKIDYIMILPNKMAVQSFMSSGQLRIGGDLSVTLGPIGRNAYSSIGKGNIGPISIIYSYSHSKGLYGGISLHGKVLTVRNDCNKQFYGFDVNNEAILCGDIPMPFKCNDYDKIIHILHSYCYNTDTDEHINDDSKDIDISNKYEDDNYEKDGIPMKHIEACSCKLCQNPTLRKHQINILHQKQKRKHIVRGVLDKNNPFHPDNLTLDVQCNNHKKPQKQNKHQLPSINTNPFIPKTMDNIKKKRKDKLKKKCMTIHQLQCKPKIPKKTSKTKISTDTFFEPTPPPKQATPPPKLPPLPDDPWSDNKDNNDDDIKNKENDNNNNNKDKIKNINHDPYALSDDKWDKLIEPIYDKKENDNKFVDIIQNVKKKSNLQSFPIDIDIDDEDKNDNDNDNKDNESKEDLKGKQHRKYVKPVFDDRHYSDYDIKKYSSNKYDANGYRMNIFSLLFQIDDISYQTDIKIAGKLVSKQYIVNWPKKRDCKCVIIVTSKTYSSLYKGDENYDDNEYELRLICYDQRDDDLIIFLINIKFSNIKQIVNAINGAFTISPNKPWIVLESIFNGYNLKMYESMIDISSCFNNKNLLKYGDLIRANFGSLCQYGIYVGYNGNDGNDENNENEKEEPEIICFRRRFPNNGSSAFKKYRLFLRVFTGRASKKITMKYMTLNEFINDCNRIEVIYYPIPSISPIGITKKALIASNGNIKNCIFEYSQRIKQKMTLTPKEIIEDKVLSVIDGITDAVNNITDAVTPTN